MIQTKLCSRCHGQLVLMVDQGMWIHPPQVQAQTRCFGAQQATTYDIAKARKGI